MEPSRRIWLKQAGLSIAGLTLGHQLDAFPLFHSHNEAGGDDKPIRLTSNENPYGPSPMARKAMTKVVTESNRYPWDETTKLREKIGNRFNVTMDHVIVGAGSSEILGLVGQYVAKDKGHFVAADNTFRIWRRAALDTGATMTRTDLTADKKNDLVAMEKAISPATRLIYICNPNNPTGTIVDTNALKNFVSEKSSKYMMVIDEAYLEYTNQPSMAEFISTNKNVIVVKTFSKLYGLAGARIGYALAHPDTIKLLNSMQPWPNAGASTMAIAAANATLDDQDFFNTVLEKNNAEKTKLYQFYSELGLSYIESHSNFVYYALGKYTGEFQKEMEKRGILCGGIVEEENKWTRITVGTAHEMEQYRKATKEILR